MRVLKLIAVGSVAVVLAACIGTPTTSPVGAGSASAPASAAASTEASPSTSATAGGAASASAGGSGGASGDITGLALAPTPKMCALLSIDEAKAIIGKDITGTPNGMVFSGLGTNCIWQTGDIMAPATFIKVEINPVTYKANTDIVTLAGQASTQITVAGFEATAVDVGGLEKDASLVIKLDPVKPVSMLIQAPTLDMAKAVAEKGLGRLATLK
jgi:hypothetical protein